MSDRVAIMNHGQIVQFADSETVYEKPVNRFVAGFVGQQNFFESVRSEGSRLLHAQDGMQFQTTSPVEVGTVTVAVRPEAITLRAGIDASLSPNSCRALVESVSTLGDSRLYVVRSESGQTLIARTQRMNEVRRFSVGDSVCAAWQPEHVAVFTTKTE